MIQTDSTRQLEADIAKVGAMSTAELRNELDRALRLTVEHLVYLAAVWMELEHRGENLSALRRGIGRYVAAIGAGTVLAETVVAFSDEPVLLKRAAALPLAEQQRVIAEPAALGPARRTPTGARAEPEESRRPTLASILAMVKNCGAADAAELCLQLIRGSADPADVARRLLAEVERIAKTKPRTGDPT